MINKELKMVTWDIIIVIIIMMVVVLKHEHQFATA